jgi:hypothetical protein
VDPQKSKIWFSKATDQQKQQLIMHIFQAPRATQNEMYLGVPLLATRHQHFDQLMNKIITRLNGWKASMLSHTGKVFFYQICSGSYCKLYYVHHNLASKGAKLDISTGKALFLEQIGS